ncbi:MAG: hypothetical protein MUQ25_17130 [Candidatus Aminicenantes bacterium]|nr:hypothetical protein [Candidatus Aminicenantes bacterium]
MDKKKALWIALVTLAVKNVIMAAPVNDYQKSDKGILHGAAKSADVVGTTIMGFDPGRILYLKAMAEAGMGQGDLGKIRVIGAPLDECRFKFKVHKKMAEIYQLT